jgi:hypothetical protein
MVMFADWLELNYLAGTLVWLESMVWCGVVRGRLREVLLELWCLLWSGSALVWFCSGLVLLWSGLLWRCWAEWLCYITTSLRHGSGSGNVNGNGANHFSCLLALHDGSMDCVVVQLCLLRVGKITSSCSQAIMHWAVAWVRR